MTIGDLEARAATQRGDQAGSRVSHRSGARRRADLPHSILVVNGDGGVRHAVRLVLERSGFRVEGAADARGAVRLIQQRAPSLVILDRRLSCSGSDQAVVDALDDVDAPDVPILLLSNDGHGEHQADGVPGLDGGCSLPFDPNQLHSRVHALLGATLESPVLNLWRGLPRHSRPGAASGEASDVAHPVPTAGPVPQG